jgi:hypothetical protein
VAVLNKDLVAAAIVVVIEVVAERAAAEEEEAVDAVEVVVAEAVETKKEIKKNGFQSLN